MIESLRKLKYKYIFPIKTSLRRYLVRKFDLQRVGSFPFITGDSFRSLAQHIYDDLSTINPENVSDGDIVFVRTDFLKTYFKKIHIKIKNKYILISHNSDQNIDISYEKFVDDKIIHWFSQNFLFKNNKCTPIPIGIQLRKYDQSGLSISLLNKYRKQSKNPLIFSGFSVETNAKRAELISNLTKNKNIISISKKILKEDYYSQVSKCMLNISPEGNGVDCHRTWETLYLGSVPIVEKSVCTEYWANIGIPLMLVNDWNELVRLESETINEKFSELASYLDHPAIYMEYWIREVLKHKNESK